MSTSNLLAAIAVVLLMAILLAELAILWRLRTLRSPVQDILRVTDEAEARLGKAVQHYVDVNAVLGLTESFTEDPGIQARLAGYSRQVVAAALTYRLSCLGQQLKAANEALTTARGNQVRMVGEPYVSYDADVGRLTAIVAELHDQLMQANATADMFDVEPGQA